MSMSSPPPPPPPPVSPPPPPGAFPPVPPPRGPGASAGSPYAARLAIDYPAQLSRLTTAFRLILIIPIAIILGILNNRSSTAVRTENGTWVTSTGASILGALFFATVLMLVFRARYPKWWFDFAYELTRFTTRVGAYLALITDEYPSTVDQQRIHLDIDYPDDVERDLNRVPAARQVVPRDPALHRAVLPRDRRALRGRSPLGSRSCSPVSTRRACSTTWSASGGGACASTPMPSCSSPTATRRSRSPDRAAAPPRRPAPSRPSPHSAIRCAPGVRW